MSEIVKRAVRDLVPYLPNPRRNDAAVDQMAASIREFGFNVPILALSDGTIIGGHLRFKAAQKLKIEMVPVILCDEWTPVQVKALGLMVISQLYFTTYPLLSFSSANIMSPRPMQTTHTGGAF